MWHDEFEPEITSLVRRYSEKVAEEMPNDPLAQSLGTWEREESRKEDEDAEWQKWLRFDRMERDAESELLEKQCKEVAKTWEQFRKHFPNLSLLEGVSHLPTVESLQQEVCAAQSKWAAKKEKGFGKAKDHTMSFLETLEGHKALFSVFPSGDKYTSLFTGVISSVVKASVNYEHIAEGFSRALANMSADLSFVRDSTAISNSTAMKQAVVGLYVQVFKFLCEMMTWYQSPGKRFRSSINSRYYDDKIDNRVQEIRLLVKRVEREATIETQRQVKTTGQDVKALMHDMKGCLQDIGQHNREYIEELMNRKFADFEELLQWSLGHTAAGLLSSNAQRMLLTPAIKDELLTEGERTVLANIYSRMDAPEEVVRRSPSPHMIPLAVAPPFVMSQEIPRKQKREKIQEYFDRLPKYAEDDRPAIIKDKEECELEQGNIPQEILDSVKSWVGKPYPQDLGDASQRRRAGVLWVEGTGVPEFDRRLTFMGLQLYYLALMQVKIPAIVFFAKRRYSFQAKGLSLKRAGVVALFYSLVEQLVMLLPPDFDAQQSLGESSFRRLEGDITDLKTAASIVKAALEIIEALLELAPPNIMFIIDGIETFEHDKNIRDLEKLDRILRTKGDLRRRKIMYITSGPCSLLNKTTDPVAERVDSSRLVQARRRSPLVGSLSFSQAGL